MKKNKFIILGLSFVLSCSSAVSSFAATYRETIAYGSDCRQAAMYARKDGNVSSSFITSLNSYISLIDDSVLVALEQKGWRIYITAKNIGNVYYGGAIGSVAGTTEVAEKAIYIEDRTSAIYKASVHEIGHAVDAETGWTSQGAEFYAIANAERGNFRCSWQGTAYTFTNYYEYFADAFHEYYTNNANLRTRCPRTNAFIAKTVASLTKGSSATVSNGWVQSGNIWYYFVNGNPVKNTWKKISGVWYYFNASGVMQTGWQKINNVWYYMNTSGAMQTGWQKISNVWYYLNSSGAMQTGWIKLSNKWYYLSSSGAMVTGWQKINNVWYYFGTDGAMYANRYTPDGYWVNSSGAWVK